jgi:serine/threonine protein kinase
VADLELEKLGRYEIVRELGRGAMGVVYEGYDPVVGRRVAVKTARRDVIDSSTRADELMERFLREARAAGALSHPNIVTIYDAGEENGVAYIAMEFLDGTDLQKLLEQNRKFPVERVLEITSTICAALSHAHANGVIHRDIKPANVVVLDNGLIKVADFGIAHISNSQLTQEGAVIGTPHYMSPEQFMGHAIDERSDLFSAGVIVYEMLTGEKPFHGNSLSAVMHSVLNVLPVSPRQLNFTVSDCLSRVVMKALSKDVRARYQTADDMCRALKECQKESPDPFVLQVDLPETALVMGETIRSDGGSATLLSGASEAATQVLDTPPAQSLHFDSAHEAGLFLREQRVQSGKTLGQILLESHLPKRHVVALEDGSLLPFKGHEWEHIADSIGALCTAIGIDNPAPYLDTFELEYTATLKPKAASTSRRAFFVGAGSIFALLLAAWGGYEWLTNHPALKPNGSKSGQMVLFRRAQDPAPSTYFLCVSVESRVGTDPLDDVTDPTPATFVVEAQSASGEFVELSRGEVNTEGRIYLLEDVGKVQISAVKEGYRTVGPRLLLPPGIAGENVTEKPFVFYPMMPDPAIEQLQNVENSPEPDILEKNVDSSIYPGKASAPEYAKSLPITVKYEGARSPAGIASVNLWYMKDEDGLWHSTGMESRSSSGLFTFDRVSGDGFYHFALQVVDKLGLASPPPSGSGDTDTIFDSTPPSPGNVHAPRAADSLPIKVHYFDVSDNLSGVAKVFLWVKEGRNGVWTSSGLVSNQAPDGEFLVDLTQKDAKYYFFLQAEDLAGNLSPPPSDEIITPDDLSS